MYAPFNQKYPTDPAHLIHARIMTVQEIFANGDLGLLVPHQDHQFTWSAGQVNRLMHDICQYVSDLTRDLSRVCFFGPITLIPAISPDLMVQRLDPDVVPRHLYAIIDGQQRLATFALLASRLYWRLRDLRWITFSDELTSLRFLFDQHMDALLNVCSFELRDSFPCQKPILIHGRLDSWNRHDNVYGEYHSAISNYLGRFFLTWATDKTSLPDHSALPLAPHLDTIDHWLDTAMQAHFRRTDLYPTAWQIRSGMHHLDWRHFNISEVAAAVGTAVDDDNSTESKLCAFIQLWALTYTLLRRCCFVVITPTTEQGIRDMLDTRNRECESGNTE